jgi:hypothetical protein
VVRVLALAVHAGDDQDGPDESLHRVICLGGVIVFLVILQRWTCLWNFFGLLSLQPRMNIAWF